MYSFVTFFTSYSLLCLQFILYHFFYHSLLVVVRDRWHVQLRDILYQLLATVPPVHIVSFPLSFCIGCSQRSLTCTALWHSASVTRYYASSSYLSFSLLFCIGCSRRSLICTAFWHSSWVTRYYASSSYLSFSLLFCIGCSRRSLICTAFWHSSWVTRYYASSSYLSFS